MRNRISKIIISLFLAAGMIIPVTGQDQAEELVLDLQGAVDHAIAFNKTLKNARMEVERSRASVWAIYSSRGTCWMKRVASIKMA